MRIVIQPVRQATEIWVVEAHGHSGGGSIESRERIYAGPDAERAKSAYFEALILARANPANEFLPEGQAYQSMVEPLFHSLDAVSQDTAFGWAALGWSSDPVFDMQEAVIRGADIFWIDAGGAKLEAAAELDEGEAALLRSVPRHSPGTPFPIESIASAIEALRLRSAIPNPARGGPPKAL